MGNAVLAPTTWQAIAHTILSKTESLPPLAGKEREELLDEIHQDSILLATLVIEGRHH